MGALGVGENDEVMVGDLVPLGDFDPLYVCVLEAVLEYDPDMDAEEV